ncbi:murein biosynthesis integral membrane protein MurJ [Parvimonas sp. G1425]|uniref:murein biosynthesis integral membrane protein MurJ n=1 Tax=Parvimonas sp. G1425 TaxID=3387694 RepID=UPI0039E5833F
MGYTAFLLMVINILSKIFGFFREILLSYFYGTGEIATAFQISLLVPYTILGFVMSGISINFIPTYTSIERNKGKKDSEKFTSNIINIIFLISIFATILAYIFARQIVFLFAMGYSGEIFELSVQFTRITILGMFAQLLNSILKGYLNIKGNFLIPGSTGFLYNIIIIIFLIISYKINPILAPIGVAVATIFQYIPYIWAIKNTGYKHRFFVNYKDENIKKLLILALPIIFGVAVNQINQLIDKNLASFISVRGISVLSYSVKLNEFVWGILVVSIVTSIFPTLSKLAIESKPKFKVQIAKTLSTIIYLVTPACIGILIFSKEIVTLIFKRGKFDENDVILVSGVLFYYAIGLIGLGIRDVLSNAFYALKMTRIPLINSVEMVILNVITSIILSRFMGLNGLALGSSIATIFGAINLYFKLEKKIGKIKTKGIINNGKKVLISVLAMAIVSRLIFIALNMKLSSNLSFIIALLFAGLTYAIVSVLLRTRQALDILKVIFKKLKI